MPRRRSSGRREVHWGGRDQRSGQHSDEEEDEEELIYGNGHPQDFDYLEEGWEDGDEEAEEEDFTEDEDPEDSSVSSDEDDQLDASSDGESESSDAFNFLGGRRGGDDGDDEFGNFETDSHLNNQGLMQLRKVLRMLTSRLRMALANTDVSSPTQRRREGGIGEGETPLVPQAVGGAEGEVASPHVAPPAPHRQSDEESEGDPFREVDSDDVSPSRAAADVQLSGTQADEELEEWIQVLELLIGFQEEMLRTEAMGLEPEMKFNSRATNWLSGSDLVMERLNNLAQGRGCTDASTALELKKVSLLIQGFVVAGTGECVNETTSLDECVERLADITKESERRRSNGNLQPGERGEAGSNSSVDPLYHRWVANIEANSIFHTSHFKDESREQFVSYCMQRIVDASRPFQLNSAVSGTRRMRQIVAGHNNTHSSVTGRTPRLSGIKRGRHAGVTIASTRGTPRASPVARSSPLFPQLPPPSSGGVVKEADVVAADLPDGLATSNRSARTKPLAVGDVVKRGPGWNYPKPGHGAQSFGRRALLGGGYVLFVDKDEETCLVQWEGDEEEHIFSYKYGGAHPEVISEDQHVEKKSVDSFLSTIAVFELRMCFIPDVTGFYLVPHVGHLSTYSFPLQAKYEFVAAVMALTCHSSNSIRRCCLKTLFLSSITLDTCKQLIIETGHTFLMKLLKESCMLPSLVTSTTTHNSGGSPTSGGSPVISAQKRNQEQGKQGSWLEQLEKRHQESPNKAPYSIRLGVIELMSLYVPSSHMERALGANQGSYETILDCFLDVYYTAPSSEAASIALWATKSLFRIPVVITLLQPESLLPPPTLKPPTVRSSPTRNENTTTNDIEHSSQASSGSENDDDDEMEQLNTPQKRRQRFLSRVIEELSVLLDNLVAKYMNPLSHQDQEGPGFVPNRYVVTLTSFIVFSMTNACKFLFRKNRYFQPLVSKGPFTAMSEKHKLEEQLLVVLRTPISELLDGGIDEGSSSDAADTLLTKDRVPALYALVSAQLHLLLGNMIQYCDVVRDPDQTVAPECAILLYWISQPPQLRSTVVEATYKPLSLMTGDDGHSCSLFEAVLSFLIEDFQANNSLSTIPMRVSFTHAALLWIEVCLRPPSTCDPSSTLQQRCCAFFRSGDGIRLLMSLLGKVSQDVNTNSRLNIEQARTIRVLFAILANLRTFPEIRHLIDEGGFKRSIIDVVRQFSEYEGDHKSKSRHNSFVLFAGIEDKPFAEEAKRLILFQDTQQTPPPEHPSTATDLHAFPRPAPAAPPLHSPAPGVAAGNVAGSVLANPIDIITKENIVSRTHVEYTKDSLLQLVVDHLESEGLTDAAKQLRREAQDEFGYKLRTTGSSPVRPTPTSNGTSFPQPTTAPYETLDRLVKRNIRSQHEACSAPISTIPPVDLLRGHQCPQHQPKRFTNLLERLQHRRLGRSEMRLTQPLHQQFLNTNCNVVATITTQQDSLPSALCYADNGGTLFVGTMEGELSVYNTDSVELTGTATLDATHNIYGDEYYSIRDIATSPKESLLSICSESGDAFFYRPSDHFARTAFKRESVKAVRFSFDDSAMVTTDWDLARNTSHLIDIETGTNLTSFHEKRFERENNRNAACFNREGTLVLNDAVLWDVRAPRLPVFRFDKIEVVSANTFHPNGTLVIIDGNIWDLRQQRIMTTCASLSDAVSHVTFDGNSIFAVGRSSLSVVDGTTFHHVSTLVPHVMRGFALEKTGQNFAGNYGADDRLVNICAVGRAGKTFVKGPDGEGSSQESGSEMLSTPPSSHGSDSDTLDTDEAFDDESGQFEEASIDEGEEESERDDFEYSPARGTGRRVSAARAGDLPSDYESSYDSEDTDSFPEDDDVGSDYWENNSSESSGSGAQGNYAFGTRGRDQTATGNYAFGRPESRRNSSRRG